jgi:hypothetical protein
MKMMNMEEFCYKIYKHTFAHVLHSGIYAAHVIVWMRKNPFAENQLEEAFHKFVRDTPLSNMDLSIMEDSSIEEGVLLLDAIESFGDGESLPERIPFDKDLKKIHYKV